MKLSEMDLKYFILILFCGHMNKAFSAEREAVTTETQSWSTLFRSSMPSFSANSQIISRNTLGQPTQFNDLSSGAPIPVKDTTGKERLAISASSGKPETHTSAGQPFDYDVTRKPTPRANNSSQQTTLSLLTSARLPSSTNTFTRQLSSFVSTSQPLTLSVHTSSRKPPTVHNLSTQSTPTVNNSPRITPPFILNDVSTKTYPEKHSSNATAAILIAIILTSMLLAIIMIVLWKYFRKPAANDQNWAGRSPFADGETPDICLDNIRENDVTTKRTSIVSLMAWKPNKHMLLADDPDIKLFESSENNEDSSNSKAENVKDQANGTSEESADGSTIGTAVSSSDDADLSPPPPPPLIEVEGENERNPSHTSTMPVTPPIPNDSASPVSSLNCPNQVCEDNSEFRQSFPPPPLDGPNLPMTEVDFTRNQDDSNSKIQDQCLEFSISLDSDQALDECLPPPPEELL